MVDTANLIATIQTDLWVSLALALESAWAKIRTTAPDLACPEVRAILGDWSAAVRDLTDETAGDIAAHAEALAELESEE